MSCVLVVTPEVEPAVGVAPAGNRTLSLTPALRTREGQAAGLSSPTTSSTYDGGV
jgi:hypothetical protein